MPEDNFESLAPPAGSSLVDAAGPQRKKWAADDLLVEATSALLWIKAAADAKKVAIDLVLGFGGTVGVAADSPDDALPVDLSFGDGDPLLPCAPHYSVPRMLLERHLPLFVENGRRAIELAALADRLAEDAAVDTLTGLPNRRMLGRALGRLQAGDVVIMVDLDHFKMVNDTMGHQQGDVVLRSLGKTLRTTVRGRDTVGRFGGEEFVIILIGGSDPDSFVDRLRRSWEESRPIPITFSAGIARVGSDPQAALQAADRAMYRAKIAGRNRATWAGKDDYLDDPTPLGAPAPSSSAFVAFSELEVPDGGQEQLEKAFRGRLGAVDRCPGFRSLEVWADLGDPHVYAMVSWWDSPDAFRDYMQSEDHRQSHDRIPSGEHRPRARKFRRFRLVSR